VNDTPQAISAPYNVHGIPDHAEAFAKVLVTAARRIREGQSVQDVVAGMCLVEVVTAVSGRI
jgi:hypothetical protein